MVGRVLLVAIVLLIAGSARAQDAPAEKAAPVVVKQKPAKDKATVEAEKRDKALTKLRLQLEQRVKSWMAVRGQLVGLCGKCVDGYREVGLQGGLQKVREPCPFCAARGKTWSKKNRDKLLHDFYSPAGRVSDEVKERRKDFDEFTLERTRKLAPRSGRVAKTPALKIVGGTHAVVYLIEDGAPVAEPSTWVLAPNDKNNPEWFLWTDKDAPWPSEDAEAATSPEITEDSGETDAAADANDAEDATDAQDDDDAEDADDPKDADDTDGTEATADADESDATEAEPDEAVEAAPHQPVSLDDEQRKILEDTLEKADAGCRVSGLTRIGRTLVVALEVPANTDKAALLALVQGDSVACVRAILRDHAVDWDEARLQFTASHKDKYGQVEPKALWEVSMTAATFQKIVWERLDAEERWALFEKGRPTHVGWEPYTPSPSESAEQSP